VDENALMASLQLLLDILRIVEANTRITGTVQHGEPQLGRRGLWPSIGAGARVPEDERMALLWVLSLADGNHDLLDVAEQSHMDPNLLNEAAAKLERSGLLGTSLANWHDSDYGDAPAILPTTRAFAHRPRAS
jgi:aminopeptidase-like protein